MIVPLKIQMSLKERLEEMKWPEYIIFQPALPCCPRKF